MAELMFNSALYVAYMLMRVFFSPALRTYFHS